LSWAGRRDGARGDGRACSWSPACSRSPSPGRWSCPASRRSRSLPPCVRSISDTLSLPRGRPAGVCRGRFAGNGC